MLKKLCGTLAVVALAMCMGACNGARDTAFEIGERSGKGFMTKELVRGDRHRKYAVFVPLDYQAGHKYPVIVFLHGIGETGSDAHANLRVGLAPFVADRASSFPFICIFPQSDGGWSEDSEQAQDIFTALEDVAKNYTIDRDCVSLTGLSTGGVGTWAIGAKYSDKFSALVPMGSNGTADKWVPNLVNIPIRAYCNGSDMFAGFGGNDSGMVEKIKAAGGTKAEFIPGQGSGHNCWECVYSDGELFSWMQQQRISSRTKASGAAAPKSTSSSTPVRANGQADSTAAIRPN